jgi:uncharacterized membrane protein
MDAERARRWNAGHGAVLALGAWLIAFAFSSDYAVTGPGAARLAAERALATPAERGAWLWWSDVASGLALMALATWALARRAHLAVWAAAALVLWAPGAAVYANETLTGALVLLAVLVVAGVPGERPDEGPERPPGWDSNPSSWPQRAPIVGFALLGFFVSRYLAAYQLGHIATVWDPFFGDGTRRVLESEVSRAWPVSDAGLGAISYALEAVTGLVGGTRRWRTLPWMVLLFGVLVVPLGIVSIVLVALQPLAVGAWCTLCLATAAVMLVMIAPALDEVIATVQHLLAPRVASTDEPAAEESAGTAFLRAVGLYHVPATLVLSAAVGAWLMAAPDVLGARGAARASEQLAGALAVTAAVIAFAPVARAARWLNVALGLWLVASPIVLAGASSASLVNDVLAGLALAALAFPRGRVDERFGGWDRCVV